MTGLDLIEGQKIIIENCEYSVSEIIKRDIMKNHEERIHYFTYELKSSNNNVTHAALDYLADDNLIFHLTKKTNAKINEDFIEIDSDKYSIVKIRDEIYIDAVDGDLREAKCYDVSSDKTGLTPSELHIHRDNNQIFYLTLNLKKDEVLIK
ncbi:MAG: hypothetical protein ACE5RF_03455 [Nitrosarchaeum sp.]